MPPVTSHLESLPPPPQPLLSALSQEEEPPVGGAASGRSCQWKELPDQCVHTNFFQRSPPFLIQLQNILRKYPDGGQILKELIQNADDAQASEVIFIYDEREYGTKTLDSEDLQSIQGPALLAYNNQTFSDIDWKGIQEPGNSIKRKDPNTVGRFGLGFNSVYHITDYPAIFSGKNIGILDPQETVFHRGGRWWNLEKHKHRIEELEDQFHPFQTVLENIGSGSWSEILSTGHFNGTLFRFPLRLTPSEISDNLYNSERVQELFESFIGDAGISLLFLRHVSTVSIKRIGSDGSMHHLLTINVTTEKLNEAVFNDLSTGTHFKVTSMKCCDREKEECQWLVITSSVHGNLFPQLMELSKKLCNKPTLDVAYPLTKQGIAKYGGRLSCFLPLPDKEENRTGLPILINGSFDLTDDRRSMKWLEVDQQHDEAAKWNHILIENLLPLIYTCAVKDAVSLVKASKVTAEVAYGVWPDPAQTMHKGRWHNLTKVMAQLLLNERILQTADNSLWITVHEAVFTPLIDDNKLLTCLEKLLLMLKQPLVKIPGHVHRTILLAENSTVKLNTVSPAFIRKILRNGDWSAFPNKKKMLLLLYVISDKQYSDLLNLQLLPLSDGTFTQFQNTDRNGLVFIDSTEFPRILLPGLVKRFLPIDIPNDLLVHLRSIVSKRIFKNLVFLNEDVICRMLQLSLPKTWQVCHNPVNWYPQDPSNPPIEWLSKFWHFLQLHENILDALENQPLVPLTVITKASNHIQLARLTKKTTLLFQSLNGQSLPDGLAEILKEVGCTIIQNGNSWLWHKYLHKYILEPTPNNILKILSQLNLQSVLQKMTHMPEKCIKIFCKFLSQAFSFRTDELEILYKLPIFCSVQSIGCSGTRLVAALQHSAVMRNTAPSIPEDLVFPEVLLQCRDDFDLRLLQQMKVTLLSATDVALLLVKAIQTGVFCHHQQEAQRAMLWILRNGHTLFGQSEKLKKSCKSLNFIPCNGKIMQPSAFFDPDIAIFKELFEHNQFPPFAYNEVSVLISLRTLGLKNSLHSITSDEILQIASKISLESVNKVSMKRAIALISVCNSTDILSKMNSKELKKLCSLAWVPIGSKQPSFTEPQKLRSQKYYNIVEYSVPITNDFNDDASSILGINDPPPPLKVVENLAILSQQYQKEEHYTLIMKLHKIYQYIQMNSDHFHHFLPNVLIWNGEGFSSPSNIVLLYPEDLDLICTVKKVPSEFLDYRKLFIQCGVRNTLSKKEVISILYTLKNSIETRTPVSGTFKEMKLAISILDWMRTNDVHGTHDLPIPVQDVSNLFNLKPLSTTLFCDMDKQYLKDASVNCTDYHIVHEDLSPSTARFLNIKLLSTTVLKPEFFEPWGPSEPVTLRIKNILREYSEHVEVFKELIQNADDADATECDFLVDMRQNAESRQSLIDDDMASCHGPALWSYNNSKFTDNDFRNITRIGAATKETQVQKIGKFGLGFNTVYHITDVPSIMSGSQILIFDPNVNHIKKHIPHVANPGIKLDLQKNSEALNIFTDQFHPFSEVFGCELKQPFYFNGTLIRLPFRTEQEAKDSQICNQVFNKERINSLIEGFEESQDTLIIFLKNVQYVTLHFLAKDLNLKEKVIKVKLQKDRVQCLEVAPDIILQQEQIIASEKLGMQIESVTMTNIIRIAVHKTMQVDEKHYLIQSSLGIKESFQMFSQKKEFHFSVPAAGVALKVKKDPFTGKWAPDLLNFEGIVFCSLPLPVFSGLPFHIHGCFSVMSNRKTLWDTTEKGEWNKKLLCDAVIVALITALAQLQKLSQNGDIQDYCYYTFWPDITKVKTLFMEAVKAFYRALTFGFENCFPALFGNGQEYCTIKHACFLQLDNIQDEEVHDLAKTVFSSFLKKPYLAVSLPDWVKNSFISSNCSSHLQLNMYNLERFYSEIVFENLESLDTEDRNSLILHAIDMQNNELNWLLKSKPCIPSSSHGRLQFIEKLVHPSGKVSILYDQKEGCFPQGADFLTTERLSCLQHLGMIKDKLPLKELMERACKIKDVWKQDRKKGLQQICCILELLNDLLDQFSDNSCQAEFRKIVFLPAFAPQKNIGGIGEIGDLILMKSADIYHYQYNDLVCMVKPVLCKQLFGKQFTFSDNLLAFLGLNRCPTSDLVLSQLQETHLISNLLHTQDQSQIVKKCYSFLNKLVQQEPNQAAQIKMQTSSIPLIYIGQEFVALKYVACKISFDAVPYLYKLPQEYAGFHDLWACVGLCNEFSIEDYVSALERIVLKHKERPLPESEQKVAEHVLAIICNDESVNLFAQRIVVPDQQSILRHVDKIYYNDTPWLSCDEDLHFCHGMIPREVALKLGIQTKIHQTLQKCKVSDLSRWVSQFGSKENITTRLKNIINEYSTKKDILKELIQNADDSEATEIHFVLDSRTHPTKCTFGPEWHPLQSPALCVYNNKKFESRDIDGIQHLGIGGKQDRLDRTGKFGLGFNSVYHITDCPSFVTGDGIMCVFDPNCNFLPTADDSSPGGMFTVNKKFKDTFKDVYHTFLPSLFNLEEGTLFRLPLRMSGTVAMSKISDQTISLKDIMDMCQELEQDADSMILFLNYINKITFSKVSDTDNIQEILSIAIKTEENKRRAFHKKLSALVENDNEISEIASFNTFYKMEIKCSRSKNTNHWIICKQIGTEGDDNLAELITITSKLQQTFIPHGAVAACLNDNPKGRAFCTLPMPVETELPVHISGNFIVDSARRDICKEDGGNPKTNFNTFLLSRIIAPLYCRLLGHLQKEISLGSEEPLKFKKLDSCKLFLNEKFLRFFPSVTSCVSPQWKQMVVQVYQKIFEKQLKVIPIYREIKNKHGTTEIVHVEWSAVGQNSVTDEPYFILDDEYNNLGHVLNSIHMKLTFGGNICTEFKASGVAVLELNPKSLCNFLRKVQLHPQGHNLPKPVGETLLRNFKNCTLLLQYCLKVPITKKADYLQGVPLLVTEDDMLQNVDRNEHRYYTKFYALFPTDSNLFAKYRSCCHHELVNYGYLQCLTIQNAEQYIKKELGPEYKISCRTLPEDKKEWLKSLWNFFENELKNQMDDDKLNKELFEEIIPLFNDWAILPVCYQMHSREIKLLSLDNMNNILNSSASDVSKCLFKLGFPKLDPISLSVSMKVHVFYSYLLNTEDSCSVLQRVYSMRGLHWEMLENSEMDTFLSFFLNGLENLDTKKDYLHQLQSLPLFETQQNKWQKINTFQKKYILKDAIELKSEKLYELDSQTIFLKNNKLNNQFSKYNNICVIDATDFLVDYLLPHIESLCQNEILEIIWLVLKLLSDFTHHNKKPIIIEALKPLKFVRDKQGVPQQVSYFYDYNVDVFSIFGLQSKFIPEELIKQFGNKETHFHTLMLDLGMQSKLSEDDFIQFAYMIEKESTGNFNLEKLSERSKKLFKNFLSMDTNKITDYFLKRIKDIKFLIPLDVSDSLRRLHNSYTENKITVALNGSLLKQDEKDESLVWTTMPMLKKRYFPCKKMLDILKTKCGVFFSPPSDLVVENVKNVCKAPCENKQVLQTRSVVLKTIYTELQSQGKFNSNSLADVPFILVDGDALAKPRQVVFSLFNENYFHPYLYKLPPFLACYSQLFQNIGVEAEATLSHYAEVLSSIYEDTLDKKSLHPNLNKTVQQATQQLFKLLEDKKPKDLKGLKRLYLLAMDGKLHKSSTLVINNCRILKATSNLNETFNYMNIFPFWDRYKLNNLFKCLPTDIRPKLLSQITTEIICDTSENICTHGDNCENKRRIQELLVSPVFLKALSCLLRSQSEGKLSDAEAFQICNGVFGKLEILCFRNLETILVYQDKPLNGTTSAKSVFVTRTTEGHCQIYLNHAALRGRHKVKVCTTLANEINKLMENAYTNESISILLEILNCETPDDIINVLEENELFETLGASHKLFSLPNPGEPIPIEWYDSLDMSPLNSFKVDEYVGYMDPSKEECYLYAIIVEELDSKIFENCEIQMYRISLGHNIFTDVSILDLYQFKRVTSYKNQSLVLIDNPRQHEEINETWHEMSIQDSKKDVDQYLNRIWKLPKDERAKAIRRLYLKYHPDKNIGQEKLATEICKYIQQRIRDLEAGKSFRSQTTSSSHSNTTGFSNFWGRWDKEASRHRQNHEKFSRKTKCEYDFFGYHSRSTRPNPEEAQRWFRQAECDLRAAENDVGHNHTEWVFYKVHQAVEKALFSAQYIKNGKTDKSDIGYLAKYVSTYCTSLHNISKQVLQMEMLGVDKLRTQYPNHHKPPHIPNDSLPSDKENTVIALAKDVLEKIKGYVN
ncbi:sacsin-like [Discoglossus pictus]